MKPHVALVGFMASGKSTIGRKLARRLGWPFVDTDAVVVREHGPIAAIFEGGGETAFRRYEREAVHASLASTTASVIALGGGALTAPENRALLAQHARSVFIKVSPEQVYARVKAGRGIRPLLGSSPTLAGIKELYDSRMPQYESADHLIDASRCSDAAVVDEIVAWLQKHP